MSLLRTGQRRCPRAVSWDPDAPEPRRAKPRTPRCARGSGGPGSPDALGAGVAAHRVDARDLDHVAGRRGVDHLAVADVDPDVAHRAVEEDQVTGLQLVAGDRAPGLRLHPARVR